LWPLVVDLKILWKTGVPEVWDEYKREEFIMHVVGVSYVVTKFAMVPESLLAYYMTKDTSASARMPL
jgi:hypothetical protein